jgi:AraC-like DNA-binding protein
MRHNMNDTDLSLSQVAGEVGLSRFHFIRVFRREIGITPYQYLIQQRIRLAVQLLLDTDKPITEIALEVGFEDLSGFISTFRRLVGQPPRQFRSGRLVAS